MFKVKITFYHKLLDFFSATPGNTKTEFIVCERRSVKDLIESFGIPHTELGEIMVNRQTVRFSFIIQENCEIDVYPLGSLNSLEGGFPLNSEFRFCCDVHLGTLAKRLRLLGLDTVYDKNWQDRELAEASIKEGRYLLTRDRQLLMRRRLRLGLYIRNITPDKQVLEVVNRLNLKSIIKPFSRCLVCNGILQVVDNRKSVFREIEKKIPTRVKQWNQEFTICTKCGNVYWKGSHFKKLQTLVEAYLK